MSLRAKMARDAQAFARADHFGESVIYRFAAGGTRSFRAVVNRLDLEPVGGELRAAVRAADVFLPYDTTNGVTAVRDGDEVDVVLELGQPAVRCRILQTLTADEGGFLVRVQK